MLRSRARRLLWPSQPGSRSKRWVRTSSSAAGAASSATDRLRHRAAGERVRGLMVSPCPNWVSSVGRRAGRREPAGEWRFLGGKGAGPLVERTANGPSAGRGERFSRLDRTGGCCALVCLRERERERETEQATAAAAN